MFDPVMMATSLDPGSRGELVGVPRMFVNVIVAGEPQTGKTTAEHNNTGHAICSGAMVLLSDLKGMNDHDEFGPFCPTWISGNDHEHIQATSRLLKWVVALIGFRRDQIHKVPAGLKDDRSGMTRALSEHPQWGSVFYPVVLLLEEFWDQVGQSSNWTADSRNLARIMKYGPAAGISTVITSHEVNAQVFPKGITRMARIRMSTQLADDDAARTVFSNIPAGRSPSQCKLDGEGYIQTPDGYRHVQFLNMDRPTRQLVAAKADRLWRPRAWLGPDGRPLASNRFERSERNRWVDLDGSVGIRGADTTPTGSNPDRPVRVVPDPVDDPTDPGPVGPVDQPVDSPAVDNPLDQTVDPAVVQFLSELLESIEAVGHQSKNISWMRIVDALQRGPHREYWAQLTQDQTETLLKDRLGLAPIAVPSRTDGSLRGLPVDTIRTTFETLARQEETR